MSFEERLLVIVDASGSMHELGKSRTARNLLAYLRECLRLGHWEGAIKELEIVVYGTEASLITLRDDEDLPSLEPSGQANLQRLVNLVDSRFGEAPGRILFLSDGYFSRTEFTRWQAWRKATPQRSFRAVAVGADARLNALATLADSGGVFPAEDIIAAVACWPLRAFVALPTKLAELPLSEGTEARA